MTSLKSLKMKYARIAAFLVMLAVIPFPAFCPAAEYTVTNTSNSDTVVGSLPWALKQPMDPSDNTIKFNIPGGVRIPLSDVAVPNVNVTFTNVSDNVAIGTSDTRAVHINTGTSIVFEKGSGRFKLAGNYGALQTHDSLTTDVMNIKTFAGTVVNDSRGGFYSRGKTNIGEFVGAMRITCNSSSPTAAGVYGALGVDIKKFTGQITVDSTPSYGNPSQVAGIYSNYGVSIDEFSGSIKVTFADVNAYGITSAQAPLKIADLAGDIDVTGLGDVYGLASRFDSMVIGIMSGKIKSSATAAAGTAFGIYSYGTLGNEANPAVISGHIHASSDAGRAVAIAAGGAMNLYITGTAQGEDKSGTGMGYAIAAGRWIGEYNPVWERGSADNTITLDTGANLIGKVDLGDGNNTLNLWGTGSLNNNFTGVSNLVVGNGSRAASWTMKNVTGTFGNLLVNPLGYLTINGDFNVGSVDNSGTIDNRGEIILTGDLVNNGVLTGNGEVTGNVINNGIIGSIAQRSAAGTIVQALSVMSINGDFAHNAGSNLVIEVDNSGSSSQVAVTGAAYLNDGTISVLGNNLIKGRINEYAIVTADGGVSGRFEYNNANPLIFMDLIYKPNKVDLLYGRNTTSFADIGLTYNQRSVANALDRIEPFAAGDMQTIFNALTGSAVTAAELRSAYDQMGGLVHTSIGETVFSSFNKYANTVANRMEDAITGGISSKIAWQPVNFASRDSIMDTGNMILAALGDAGMEKQLTRGFWIQGYGFLGDRDGDDISSRYDYDTAGIAVGFDKNISDSLLLGTSAGYSYTDVDMDDLSSNDSDIKSFQGSIYGMYKKDSMYVDGVLTYSFNRVDTSRFINFGGLSRTATADYDAHMFGGYLEAGYKINTKLVDIVPMAAFTGSYILRNSFSETGADALNLDAESENATFLVGSLGVKIRRDFATPVGVITPELRARWDHRFTDDTLDLNASFTGYPQVVFNTKPDDPDHESLGVGAAVYFKLRDNVDLLLAYDGLISSSNSQHGGIGGLVFKW